MPLDDPRPGPAGAPSRPLSRRRFVQGVAAGGALAGLGLRAAPGLAAAPSAPVLSGSEFHLTLGEAPVNVTGRVRPATVVDGTMPAPTLRWREGDTVTLRVTNRLPVTSSIHWHGILLPFEMDGVPGLSYDGIQPGETFVYRFPVGQSGTYWYHSHSRFQEQTGLYGAIVVEPRAGERFPADREHVVVLSDWSDEDPETIYANLKKQSDYYNYNQPTAAAFALDVSRLGLARALEKRRMWNRMRMSPTDLSDVGGHTYTYLMNGAAPAANWSGLYARGEKVRLRFVNASATTFFDVRIPGLKLTVVAADGQDVEPVTVDEFRIAVAETYDVIVEPGGDRPYTVYAQSIDRSGYARGTLTPRLGLEAEVPPVDAPRWLTMVDMMGAMAMPGMGHDMGGGGMGGHDMGSHHGTGGSGHDMGGPGSGAAAGGPGVAGSHDMAGMAHGGEGGAGGTGQGAGGGGGGMMRPARHARSEYGPGVDMRVDMPRTNLDDPGIGLRDNGRRVLAYADLRTVGGPADPRGPGREIELHLTGHMERYMWSFDGRKFSAARPLHLRHGERLRVVLSNDTMMPHPIHLHGMWSELESPDGMFQVRKHTVMVQPAQRVSYLVTAEPAGRWAYHCHLLYHMEAGMFREVVVS